MKGITKAFEKIIEFISTHKTPIIAMASIVVCITTYSLILPALTLTIEKAQEQGGISLTEMAEDAASTSDDAASTEASDEKKDEKPASTEDEQQDAETNESPADKATDEQGEETQESQDELKIGDEAEETEDKEAEEEPEFKDMVLSSVLNDKEKVTVKIGKDAEVPEGSSLEVSELLTGKDAKDAKKQAAEREAKAKKNSDSAEKEAEITEISKKEFDAYVKESEKALGWDKGSASDARLLDIKIVDKDGNKVTIAAPVEVRIELADDKEKRIDVNVVHFADNSDKGDTVDNDTKKISKGQAVEFEAEGFSIYAIVDSQKRLQYNFYDGTSLLISEYIKKQDNVLQELYDPGVEPEYGQTFIGWAYTPNETNPSNIYTIEELNDQAADRYSSATEELTQINVYAIYDEAWYLRYMDTDAQGNATVLNVVRVRKNAADKNVTIDYTFTPEEGIVFEGWTDVATAHTYQQGDVITLDHHVDLYVKLQGRNWLVFDSNAGGPGSGATYTPPQLLIGDESVTTKPDDPTRRGYTFTGWNTKADGTGTWWYRTNGSVNRFGNTLSADTTLYAQWEANNTDYYVVFWKQKATDAAGLPDGEKQYDYVSSEKRTAKTGASVSTTTADRQKGGTANREYGYYFTYNENNSDTTTTVNADGTTVLNVYYDRREITYNFTSNSDFTVKTYTGVVDGETVELTPDGNGGYTYQKTVTETVDVPYTRTRYNISDNDLDNNPQKYIVRNNAVTSVYYAREDRWSPYHWYATNYPQWYSTVYDDYTRYITSNSGAYGFVDGEMIRLNPDGTYTTTVTRTVTEPYTGEVSTSTIQTRSATYTGLYGSAFEEWPNPGNGRVWTVNIGSSWNPQKLSLPVALTLFDPQAALTPTTTQTTVNFTADNADTGYTMTLYTQTPDGEWVYTNDNILTTANLGGGTWYPTETFEGFTVHSYQVGNTLNPNGTWTPVTASGSFDYRNNVFLRYSRNQHSIHFISQGSHVTGRTEEIVDNVYYDSNLSKYAEGGSAYYEPTNGMEGYYFAGWYSDPECQIPYDFNTTMPDSDITVYAKWDTYRVRTVLVPTPNNEHNDEVEFANNQSLSFRLDYNEEVSDANINSSVAKRAGYNLIGWYYSPDFDPSTEVHFPLVINKDTPGVNMNYQSSEDWNKYGDNDGNNNNVRGILKLYAKWELNVDENSVYIEYDVDDVYRTYDTAGMLQTTIPVDDHKYALTNEHVTFQVAEAPTNYTSGFEFYRWVLLNPDGSESDIMYNPADMANEVPSSYIYEETITDDLGHTATIKRLRLKAKFNIETEKVTTVTFDGNGGVTNDSAENASVTESYPINKDFNMKDEDSFVREGYTLLGWAFQREDGTKITPEAFKQAIATMTPEQLIQAGIYRLGQKVAADNLEISNENNWDPLENTVYAVWEINKYTVTVKKLVDGETAADKQFTFAALADGDYTIPAGDTNFQLVNGGQKEFVEVPYGTVLTFTETPAIGYTIKSVDAKQTSRPDGTPLDEEDYIELVGADSNPYTIHGDVVITYTNEKVKEQKLRIKKIGDDATGGLAGAKFDLTETEDIDGFNDLTGIVSMTGADLGYLPGNDDEDETLFKLPVGTYTLSETEAPQYYDGLFGTITLNVTTDGITMTKSDTTDTAVISGPDSDGEYTLTVTDKRKHGNVTIIKNVVGTDDDEAADYSFSQTGLTGDAAFDLRGSDVSTTQDVTDNQKVYKNIKYGTTFSVEEANTYTDFDTTIEISKDAGIVTVEGVDTGNVIVDDDVTITYTNTRNKQPVKVVKLDDKNVPLAGAEFSMYTEEEYAKPEDQRIAMKTGLISAEGTGEIDLDDLALGTYYLVETEPPAGYIPLDKPVVITNGSARVSATLGTDSTAANIAAWDADDKYWKVSVHNNPGYELPHTGGIGVNWIYIVGILMVLMSGVALLIGRRVSDK